MTVYTNGEHSFLELPRTPDARQAIDWIMRAEAPEVARHSLRSYLFARLIADHQGAVPGRDYDPAQLFMACALHDIGLTEDGDRGRRFEVDGADVVAEFLTARGWNAADVDIVWEAIALHTSRGIAERRGTVCALTSAGIGADFRADGDVVPDAVAVAIHRVYPRGRMAGTLVDAIVGQAGADPQKAPPYSLTAQLLRERAHQPSSSLEILAQTSRWGC